MGHTAPSSARPAWVRPELALSKQALNKQAKNEITDHSSGNDDPVTEEHCQQGDVRQNGTHVRTHTHTCVHSQAGSHCRTLHTPHNLHVLSQVEASFARDCNVISAF